MARRSRSAALLALVLAAAACLAAPARAEGQVYVPAVVSRTLPDAVAAVATRLDSSIAVTDAVSAPVREPAKAAVSVAVNNKAALMEGPVRQATLPAYQAGSAAVAGAVRFIEGPMYNKSGPVRAVANKAIVGLAQAIEGPPRAGVTAPEDSANFISPVASAMGRKTLLPGLGRLVSVGLFGLIPKPPARDYAKEERRDYDPAFVSQFTEPTGKPHGERRARWGVMQQVAACFFRHIAAAAFPLREQRRRRRFR
jgi:hypothetical protein